ncbi:MAG: DUF2029 domain-containing protein [candidate division Zixibacteria bacterium]|nr:DUF2029 domain-containing protein [candidate division Zixibacteria bacterium]
MNKIIESIKENKFIWVMAVYFVLFYVVQNFNNRFWMHDFEVYYTASKHFISGQQVYNQAFGLVTGVYKYSPFALIIFAPLAILPFFWAKTIYFFLVSGVIIFLILYIRNFIHRYFFHGICLTKTHKILFFSTLITLVHIYRELHLGNINALLLTALILSLNFIISNREYLGGFLIGIVILFKPHFVALLPLFFLRNRFKALLTVLVAIVTGTIIPIIISGVARGIDLHRSWMVTMIGHNTGFDMVESVNTIPSLLYRFAARFILPDTNGVFSIAVILIVAGLILLLLINNQRWEKSLDLKERKKATVRDFSFEYLVILAVIPSITITDTEHFLLSIPLIMFLLFFLCQINRERNVFFYLAIAAFILYGGNWHDLLGHQLSSWVSEAGLLGLGNIIILAMSLYAFSPYNS